MYTLFRKCAYMFKNVHIVPKMYRHVQKMYVQAQKSTNTLKNECTSTKIIYKFKNVHVYTCIKLYVHVQKCSDIFKTL